MPRTAKGLTAGFIEKSNKPGRYGDGGGLYLLIRPTRERGTGRWFLLRYRVGGKLRELGLGSATGPAKVTLAEARKTRDRLMAGIRAGIDPLAARAAAKAAEAKAATFHEVAEQFIEAHSPSWRNPKHRQQWSNSLRDYAYESIGARSVASIDVTMILNILTPIWQSKSQTASRLRSRIESILDYAKAKGLREGENPARWKGGIDHLLPAARRVAPVRHYSALDYNELPAFMTELRALGGRPARLTEFIILTAARSGEARGALWSEIDMDARLWQIPGEKMKSGRPHRVPLSDAVVEILRGLPRVNDHVFAGRAAGGGLAVVAVADVLGKRLKRPGITTHGFRSTFRDWAGDVAHAPREVAEACLAHASGDATERSYARSDMLERRRTLMEAWAVFAAGGPADAKVVELRARGG
jgi:integrase